MKLLNKVELVTKFNLNGDRVISHLYI